MQVELSVKDIEMLLSLLIYDGKIDKIFSGDNRYLYKSIKPLMNLPGLVRNPCGLCPVRYIINTLCCNNHCENLSNISYIIIFLTVISLLCFSDKKGL